MGFKHKYFTHIKLYFDICKSKNLAKKAIREPGEVSPNNKFCKEKEEVLHCTDEGEKNEILTPSD